MPFDRPHFDGLSVKNTLFRLASIAFTIMACSAQKAPLDERIRQLTEHWHWKQYWEGTTELGNKYVSGRQFQALLFWRTDANPPSVGFCSTDLGLCHFYPNSPGNEQMFEETIPNGNDSLSAYRKFLANSFGEKSLIKIFPDIRILPNYDKAQYTESMTSITLPRFQTPEAIRNRLFQSDSETESLISSLMCRKAQSDCRTHLLIPFYSHNDPNVPVYRQCSGCSNTKPMIIYMKLIDGIWWHGALDYNDSPRVVKRTRKKIENGLMLDVSR